MPLPGQIEGALSSAPGFDSDTIITAAVAQPFFAAGYRSVSGIFRWGPRRLET